jgi:cytochrome c-type biogenesis protein CcmH
VDELQARLLAELERRTPAGLRRHSVWLQRGSGLLLAVLVPVGAMLLYTQVGDPQAVVRLGQVQESDHMAGRGRCRPWWPAWPTSCRRSRRICPAG